MVMYLCMLLIPREPPQTLQALLPHRKRPKLKQSQDRHGLAEFSYGKCLEWFRMVWACLDMFGHVWVGAVVVGEKNIK